MDFKKIQELLNPVNGGKKYVIPQYQRAYSWGQSECDQLLNDIEENDEGYFVGSAIAIQGTETDDEIIENMLIDGQQRFTSISLLLLAIYHLVTDKYKDDFNTLPPDNGKKLNVYSVKKCLILLDNNDNFVDYRLTPQIIANNKNDYRYLVNQELGIEADDAEPNRYKTRKIYKNYNFYLKKLENKEFEYLLNLLRKCLNVELVYIAVNNDRKALMMFEALNNRGIVLSPVDLIKNRLFIMLQNKTEKVDFDTINKSWNKMLFNLDYNEKITERFFRHYYNAFIKEKDSPRATKTNMVELYNSVIEKDDFVSDLINKSKIYGELTEKIDDDSTYKKELYDLLHIQAAPSYSLLMYLFAYKEDLSLNENDLRDILKNITVFFLRRHLTDKPATRDLDKIFIDLIEDIKGKDIVNIKKHIINNLLEKLDENDYRNKLLENIYDVNPNVARFILCAIESGIGKEYSNKYWERKKNKYIWTIEHVLPENENLNDEWKKMISPDSVEQSSDIQERCLHKLGNLTLSGYNSELQDDSFEVKQNKKNKSDEYIGYKNGLKLNNIEDTSEDNNKLDIKLSSTSNWTEEKINRRTEELKKNILALYPYELID